MSRMTLVASANRMWLTALVAGLTAIAAIQAQAAVVDLSYSASPTGFGLNPTDTLSQGTAAGIADGSLFDWGTGVPTSPRDFTATSLSPYETWSTPQAISSVRVWEDDGAANYDSISVSVLNSGGNPANLSDWTQVYTSGTGLNKNYADISLGGTYTTEGLKVTAAKTASDINVGEVAAFGPLPGGGTLTDHLVTPTGATASSTDFGRVAGNGIDGNWTDSSLSAVAASDPSVTANGYFTYDISYNAATLDALQINWGVQGGFAQVPSQWTIEYNTVSDPTFQPIGTFSEVTQPLTPTQIMYYTDLDSITGELTNVATIRLLVNAADESTGRMSVAEFQAFSLPVPEPASLGLLAVGGLMLLRRRRV